MRVASTLRVWAVLGVISLAACGGGRSEDPNLRRGRELLAMKEPDAAVREFRLALKNEPKNERIKALLLVALLRTDDALPDWYEAQILFDRIRFLKENELQSLDGFEGLTKHVTNARQGFYDKGLDTRDTEELWDLTLRAAEYSFKEADDEEKDYAAFVLALHKDDKAVDFLVERLKSEKASYLPGLLSRLGGVGERGLTKVANEPENLGRPRALDTLAVLRERQAAESFFQGSSNVDGLHDSHIAEEYANAWAMADAPTGLTRDRALYGVELHGPEAAPLRVHWVALDDSGARRLMVMQGFDRTRSEIVTRFYGFTDGALTEITPSDGPEVLRLATEGPITLVERADGGARILQLGKGSVPVLQETKRSSFKKGDKVRVRANKKVGVVAGVDEFGLLLIELEPPNRGTLTLTPSAVRGMETVIQQRIGQREYRAQIAGARIDIKQQGEELLPL